MRRELLFVTTAVIECATGLGLLAMPDTVCGLLLGVELDGSGALEVARIAGAALLALGLACWAARGDAQGRTARGILVAMLCYNTLSAVILAHAALRMHLTGVGLWPAILVHAALAGWCLLCLREQRSGSLAP